MDLGRVYLALSSSRNWTENVHLLRDCLLNCSMKHDVLDAFGDASDWMKWQKLVVLDETGHQKPSAGETQQCCRLTVSESDARQFHWSLRWVP